MALHGRGDMLQLSGSTRWQTRRPIPTQIGGGSLGQMWLWVRCGCGSLSRYQTAMCRATSLQDWPIRAGWSLGCQWQKVLTVGVTAGARRCDKHGAVPPRAEAILATVVRPAAGVLPPCHHVGSNRFRVAAKSVWTSLINMSQDA